MPAKTQRPRARVSLSPASAEGRVPGTPVRNSRASPAAAAPGLRAPEGGTAHAHAHARERRAPASPVPRRRRRRARAGARESEREAGAAGGAGARERRSCIRSSAPKPRPSPAHRLLPRAGSARPNPRACARVRRPGPSGGGPVDSNESVASERGEPTASVCGCARLQVSAGRGCGRGPGRPRGGRGGGGRGGAARKKRVLAALGGTRQLQEVRAAPAARRERGRAWGRGAPGAAQAGERARAAARRRQWLPRARARRASAAEFMAAPARTAAVHRGGGGDGPEPGAERGPPGAAPRRRGPRRAAPQQPAEEGAGTPALALPGAPAELGKPAARRPRPRPREGGGGPGASRPGSARGASSGLAGGAGRGAARRGAAEPGRTPVPDPRRQGRRGSSLSRSEQRP
ncbi:hypothetical protein R6Z07F_018250 [Ovis aries]